MQDTDLEIRGARSGGGGGGKGGHPDPYIRVGPVSKKSFFGPSGLSLV